MRYNNKPLTFSSCNAMIRWYILFTAWNSCEHSCFDGFLTKKGEVYMDEWKSDRIASALKGENPTVITRMKSGFVVLADPQFLPGYCILLSYPKVFSLNDLNLSQRWDFLLDMSLIGDALIEVCSPVIRINYDILGNTDNYLHAHITPRYEWEGEAKKHPI